MDFNIKKKKNTSDDLRKLSPRFGAYAFPVT